MTKGICNGTFTIDSRLRGNDRLTKGIIVVVFIILALLAGGCSKSSADAKGNPPDSLIIKKDVKNNLSGLEETFEGFDYESVIDLFANKLPENTSITKFKYFVVFSELGEELTYKLIDTDIRNTIDAIQNSYAAKTPADITPLFLFKDYESYKDFVLKNYDIPERDLSPYGFYKVSKNVIVIRYVSWKGSIAHEITHKFNKHDFPDMPSWFDEGIASLHEKSNFINGELIGDFSLRIIPLRRAIKENTYTGLETLMKTNDEELYGTRTPFYYAQSRYLLMYLQEKGLLKDYYRLFRETFPKDNTGITQLEKILGKTIEKIDEEYLDYINSFNDR